MILVPSQIKQLNNLILEDTGSIIGIRDEKLLQSATYQPWQTFGGVHLYQNYIEKCAVLCYGIIRNHPFIDGNKRTGHAAMETLISMQTSKRYEGTIDSAESILLRLAKNDLPLRTFINWATHNYILTKVRQDWLGIPDPEWVIRSTGPFEYMSKAVVKRNKELYDRLA